MGVAVAEKDKTGQDNRPFAQKIKQELERIVPTKVSTIWFEHYPSDTEAEFIKAIDHFGNWKQDITNNARSESFGWGTHNYKDYYYRYRKDLHRRYREVEGQLLYHPNLTDYYTLSDDQGQIVNIILTHGELLSPRQVQDLHAKDITSLHYLGDLLQKALSWRGNGFKPVKIHRVSLPPNAKTQIIWEGHRDSASDFTKYAGVRTSEVVIEDTFCLDKLEDVKRLPKGRFFLKKYSSFHRTTVSAYEDWLLTNQQTHLYLDLLQDKDALLEVNAKFLLLLVGSKDWGKFLSYLHEYKFSKVVKKDLLTEMCQPGSWQAQQLEDILQLVPVTAREYKNLLNISANNYKFELYELLYSKRKPRLSLFRLIEGLKIAYGRTHTTDGARFVSFYLQVIQKEYGTFCDYPFILTLAAQEDLPAQELLVAVLKLLPLDNWFSHELLNIALATENEYILGKLNYSPSEIDTFRQIEEEWVQNIKMNKIDILRKTVQEGNYFQVAYLAPQVEALNHHSLLLDACQSGLLGIVKVLIEKGKINSDGWDLRYGNYSYLIEYAKEGGFSKIRKYLISKGVEDRTNKLIDNNLVAFTLMDLMQNARIVKLGDGTD
ncbi:hypothetical protein [Adhaeribacter arboris]|uniref:hypothetical protein n=1 Tax=Adhaeribacter arboris TaxID=2072846 RepID=UPI0011B21D4F|nr:hypothetical protein [Adhaeribacter arboris]